ncbi:MAG: hypothetical protein Kow0059_13440 [Candidatus Sumerlaeia bacterium]
MSPLFRVGLATALIAAALSAGGCATSHAPRAARADRLEGLPREGRAIWVTRSQYHSAADVRAIMENCAAAGFNDVFFQVRGNATVFYRSQIEPWAWELTGEGPQNLGRDPGWDPLATAIEEAHSRGINLHAWVNVYPGWRGNDWPPPDAPHIWNRHPEWFMRDRNNAVMLPYYINSQGRKVVWYSFLNPAVPEVNDYLLSVFCEILDNYEVDGLHLDYVRYPHDFPHWDFSYDSVSLERFRKATGHSPQEDPEAWRRWRADQVTDLVRRLHSQMRKRRPSAALTAAVAGGADHRRGNCQDAEQWARKHYVDGIVLMNYTPDPDVYMAQLRQSVSACSGVPVYSGMNPSRLGRSGTAPEQEFRERVRASLDNGAAGVAQFSYEALFGSDHQPRPFARILREELYARPAASPLYR